MVKNNKNILTILLGIVKIVNLISLNVIILTRKVTKKKEIKKSNIKKNNIEKILEVVERILEIC